MSGGKVHVVLQLALIMLSRVLRFCLGPGGDGGLGSAVSWGRGHTGSQSLFCVGNDNGSYISVETYTTPFNDLG